MRVLTMLTLLVTVVAAVNAMYSNPFTWAMHRFYQYRGMDSHQDRYGSSMDNYSGQNMFQDRYIQQYRSTGGRHQDQQCRFQQCWDDFFMKRWGQAVSEQNQRSGFQNYEECSEGVSQLRQCLQRQLNSDGGCGCEYRDMMWAVRTARDSDGMATYAFCDDFYNDYTDRQCKDQQYRRCVQTIQRLSFAENRYRCDLRDEVSFAKQCINKYRGKSQPPSGCGNFNWFQYMDSGMEQVWMAEINGCPVYDIGKRCMNPMYENFACGNQKNRVFNEYDQCIQKYANQDGRCSPMRAARKAMQQFMKFMLEQYCHSDQQVRERFQKCCHNNEEKKKLQSGGNYDNSNDGQRFEEEKKSREYEKKAEKKYPSMGEKMGNYEEISVEEKNNHKTGNNYDNNKQNYDKKSADKKNHSGSQSNQDSDRYNQNYDKKGVGKKGYSGQNGKNGNYEEKSIEGKGNQHSGQNGHNGNQSGSNQHGYEDKKDMSNFSNSGNQSNGFQKEKKKTYSELEDRKTKGGHHGNNNRYSERGSDGYRPKDGEGRLAYLARIIRSWRDSQS